METNEAKQEAPMIAEPQKEHLWLKRLVGEWTYEGEATMEPGKAPEKWKGAESVRSLGDLWFLAEGQTEMPGVGTGTTIMTLGYDPQKEHYVGAWIGSMMAHLWVYEGILDADERVLTLDTEGADMAGQGKLTKYRDVIEFKSDDHRVLTSLIQDDDGNWQQFMTANYRRNK